MSESIGVELPVVSVVVIGRNEASNLVNTFNAIKKIDYPEEKLELIYVDTNSSDNSVAIAKEYTNKVFQETSNWPTSGLARNRGILEAKHEIIHFIDGDIAIHPDYLKKAVNVLVNLPVVAVTGFFKEIDNKGFFNRIMSIRRDDIKYENHFCESTNGGGTYKKQVLIELNGYDERILKGQETELGYRIRKSGEKIMFINALQGLHNFDLNNSIDFLKAKFIYGKSAGFLLKLKNDNNPIIRNIKKGAFKTLINGTFSLCVIIVAFFLQMYLLILLYYVIRLLYMIYTGIVLRKKSKRQLLYNLIQYLFSFASYLGVVYILLNPIKPSKKNLFNKQ